MMCIWLLYFYLCRRNTGPEKDNNTLHDKVWEGKGVGNQSFADQVGYWSDKMEIQLLTLTATSSHWECMKNNRKLHYRFKKCNKNTDKLWYSYMYSKYNFDSLVLRFFQYDCHCAYTWLTNLQVSAFLSLADKYMYILLFCFFFVVFCLSFHTNIVAYSLIMIHYCLFTAIM